MKVVLTIEIMSMIFISIFAPRLFSQTSLLTKQDVKPALYGRVFYPGDDQKYPAVIILHGSNGLHLNYDRYQAYAQQLVQNGYAVLLIDLYAETGPANAGSEKRFELWDTWQAILKNGVDYLKGLPNIDRNRIGIIGFSRGAWIALTAISSLPDVKVIVDYYGVGKQSLDKIDYIPPILMLYGEKDCYADSSFVMSTLDLLKRKNKNIELIRYPNADHGFNFISNKKANDIAAVDAFRSTLIFLAKYLNDNTNKP